MNPIIKSILSKNKGGMSTYFDAQGGRDTSELMSSRGGAEPAKEPEEKEVPEWDETTEFQKMENQRGIDETQNEHREYDPAMARMKMMAQKYGGR